VFAKFCPTQKKSGGWQQNSSKIKSGHSIIPIPIVQTQTDEPSAIIYINSISPGKINNLEHEN